MPAAKDAKRSAKAQAAGAEPKKPRTEPTLAGVLEALGQAESLPEQCRAMLAAVAPTCFGTPTGERDEHQAALVSWIGDALDGVRARLQDAVDEADNEASAAKQTKESLEAKSTEARAALIAAMEACVPEQDAVAAASEVVAAAKAQLLEAQAAQDQAAGKVEELKNQKRALEAALQEDLPLLKKEEGFKAGKHAETLVPIAKRLGLEDSVVLALPSTCSKPPSARCSFDNAVLSELESGIARKLDGMDAEVEAAVPSVDEHKPAVEAAQARLLDAEQKQQAAAAQLEAAEGVKAKAGAALDEADAALEAFAGGRGQAEEARKAKVEALTNFTAYNLECFNVLRDRTVAAGA